LCVHFINLFWCNDFFKFEQTLKIPKAPTSSNLNKTLLHVTLQLMMLISGCSVTGGGHSLRKLPTRIVSAFTYLSRQVHLQAYIILYQFEEANAADA
jgi:hypothetical protein